MMGEGDEDEDEAVHAGGTGSGGGLFGMLMSRGHHEEVTRGHLYEASSLARLQGGRPRPGSASSASSGGTMGASGLGSRRYGAKNRGRGRG